MNRRHPSQRTALLLAGILLCLGVAPLTAGPASVADSGTVVVRFDPEAPVFSVASIGSIERRSGSGVAVVRPYAGVTPKTLTALRRLPGVIAADPNVASTASAFSPNDPFVAHSWNTRVLDWTATWAMAPSTRSTTIAVIDTGVTYEDWTDPTTGVSYARPDDLGNVTFLPGWDFVDDDPDPFDLNQHGTHLASLMAATVNNAYGGAGLLWGVRILPVRVLDSNGQGDLADLIEGLEFVAAQQVDVVLLSLTVDAVEGLGTLEAALDAVVASGASVVAAAGNRGGQVQLPASYPPVLSVGAVQFNGCNTSVQSAVRRAAYTNYGPRLDLVAPGGDNAMDLDHDGYPDGILAETFDPASPGQSSYWFRAGTSIAAAHVAAIVAVLRAAGQDAQGAEDLLVATASDLAPPGYDVRSGHGLINPAYALEAALVGVNPRVPDYEFAVEVESIGSGRYEAEVTVTDADTGAPVEGVTLYGHWTTSKPKYVSAETDEFGRVTLTSPNGARAPELIVDRAEVEGAGFISILTPGGVRFTDNLQPTAYTSVEPTGNEPGCGGRGGSQ